MSGTRWYQWFRDVCDTFRYSFLRFDGSDDVFQADYKPTAVRPFILQKLE